jgi:hypothetical protein
MDVDKAHEQVWLHVDTMRDCVISANTLRTLLHLDLHRTLFYLYQSGTIPTTVFTPRTYTGPSFSCTSH